MYSGYLGAEDGMEFGGEVSMILVKYGERQMVLPLNEEQLMKGSIADSARYFFPLITQEQTNAG